MAGRSWNALVSAGQKAAKREGNARWELGDLALEAVPLGDAGVKTGSDERLREYAREIGVEWEALRQYRAVADAWPAGTRVPASWSAHRELMGHPQRKRMLKPGMTVDDLRKKRGRQPTRHDPPARTPTEKAQRVRKDLADPEVRRRLASDNKGREAITKASGEVERKRREEHEGRMREAFPKMEEAHEFITAVGRLYSAKHGAGKSLAEFRDMNLTDNQRATVLEAVEEIDNVLGWLRSFVESGSRSFDNELEHLLQEEG